MNKIHIPYIEFKITDKREKRKKDYDVATAWFSLEKAFKQKSTKVSGELVREVANCIETNEEMVI